MAVKEQAPAAMPLTEHLRELRSRLVKSVIAFVAGMTVGWIYYSEIFAWISAPFTDAIQQARGEGRTITLALTGVADPFVLQLQIAAVTGLVLSSPVWLYQLWRFVTPGLHKHERRERRLRAALNPRWRSVSGHPVPSTAVASPRHSTRRENVRR